MRYRIVLQCVALAAIGSCAGGTPPSAPAPSRAIFREIDISPFGAIGLGAPLASGAAGLAVAAGQHLFVIRPPHPRFADADSILVRLDAAQRVVALYFVYHAGKDYPAAVADYESSLGRPARRVAKDSAGGRLERVTWRDKRTRFDLTRFITRDHAVHLSSAMIDRTGPRS
jgi:hypothetical protein